MHFGIPDFCISKFHVPKALFCSNINAVLLIVRSNALASYAFLRRLKLHAFHYTTITFGYFNLRGWDKDHSTQNEMASPNI